MLFMNIKNRRGEMHESWGESWSSLNALLRVPLNSTLVFRPSESVISDKFLRNVELNHLQEEAISPDFVECLFIIKECRQSPRAGLRVVDLLRVEQVSELSPSKNFWGESRL